MISSTCKLPVSSLPVIRRSRDYPLILQQSEFTTLLVSEYLCPFPVRVIFPRGNRISPYHQFHLRFKRRTPTQRPNKEAKQKNTLTLTRKLYYQYNNKCSTILWYLGINYTIISLRKMPPQHQSGPDPKALLRELAQHNDFFDNLVDMIPAKLYVAGNSGKFSVSWKKIQ
jgi:hypothetical protein